MVLQVLYHGTAMVLQVLYYAATIFQAAGFSGATEAAEVSLILGLFKLVSDNRLVAICHHGLRPRRWRRCP